MVGFAVCLKIRYQHVIHRLEVERRLSEDHEKASFEAGIHARLDNLLNQAGNSPELLWRRIVGHAERECAAAFLPVLEILNPAAEKIRVGEHELLSGHGPESCTLEADVLHGPRQIPHPDGVADHKRLVEDDGEGSKEVPEHTLKCQHQGHTADPQ